LVIKASHLNFVSGQVRSIIKLASFYAAFHGELYYFNTHFENIIQQISFSFTFHIYELSKIFKETVSKQYVVWGYTVHKILNKYVHYLVADLLP
jgi:hypothetical protein